MRRNVLFALGAVAAVALALVARAFHPRPPLPLFGHVPAFALVDTTGAPFTTASMAGHPSVVDFVFTHCTSSCPRLTARMGKLQASLASDGRATHLVSFSVDPENDTPPVLAAYAAKAGADPARWSFVTGPVDAVTDVVVRGFKVSAAKVAKGASDYDVTHGDWFVLVDGAGQIRGYYGADDDAKLLDDVARLERAR